MPHARLDESIKRVEMDGFAFPLGAYPVEPASPKAGYTVAFEPADGDEGEGDWEEWPDRYVFDVLVSASRLEPLVRTLFSILPGRVYPILDVLGHDAYREVDPYVSYDLIGLDRVLEATRRYRTWFLEDGLVGFGAMSEEPFLYVFVDEHKIVTVRCEVAMRERIEQILDAFDLKELPAINGADSATHEHRSVLVSPEQESDALTAEEILEELQEEWGLLLNIDPHSNVDDEGNDLGITAWRCVVRHTMSVSEAAASAGEATEAGEAASGAEESSASARPRAGEIWARYAETLVTADSLASAEDLAWQAVRELAGEEGPEEADVVVSAERVGPEHFKELGASLGLRSVHTRTERVWYRGWMDEPAPGSAEAGLRS